MCIHSNYTVLRNRFVRSWHLFCVRNLYIMSKIWSQSKFRAISSLNVVSILAPTVQGFDLCGRIKMCPAEHLVPFVTRHNPRAVKITPPQFKLDLCFIVKSITMYKFYNIWLSELKLDNWNENIQQFFTYVKGHNSKMV